MCCSTLLVSRTNLGKTKLDWHAGEQKQFNSPLLYVSLYIKAELFSLGPITERRTTENNFEQCMLKLHWQWHKQARRDIGSFLTSFHC